MSSLYYKGVLAVDPELLKKYGLTEEEVRYARALTTLTHYGTKRHSGRYPWGSGENPQRSRNFMSRVKELKEQGLSESEIAAAFGMSTTEFRSARSIASGDIKSYNRDRAKKLSDKGWSNTAIAEDLGMTEGAVRAMLKNVNQPKAEVTNNIATMLKENVDGQSYIDIGAGVERELGISKEKLKAATKLLEEEGYEVQTIYVPQASNPDQYTTMKVLAKPGTTKGELYDNLDAIGSINDYSVDGGKSFYTYEPPKSVDSERVFIRYAENGGKDMDGTIQLRPGVEDISLGGSAYAQVRIAVDDQYYMKGMALYSKDIPEGYDIVYNTNKSEGTPASKVFKAMNTLPDGTIDYENPFSASIKKDGQRHYIDENGEEQLSCINKIKETGDWEHYSKTLSSQFLGKQSLKLINQQLDLTYKDKEYEYQEIMSLTNPVVKQKLLQSFAEDCDSAAVHLKATSLPGQKTKVILPITTMKDNEIYAPDYKNGETVCLIRYPHGGIFEIPELTVNNNHKEAKETLKNAPDAVGINSKVAEQLSGADFDGDTVVVIPANSNYSKTRITTSKPLEGLKGYDAKTEYPEREGMKYMTKANTQKQMGIVSNLITDMTIQGASESEVARAVRHSQTVIDAEKHKLDYTKSYTDNNIKELQEKYQKPDASGRGGAATLLSRAKSEERVPKRQMGYSIDPDTGEKIYKEKKDARYIDKDGKEQIRTQGSTRMAETNDAYTLSSGTPKENAYASYANKLKALANKARKDSLAVDTYEYNAEAAKKYKTEVDSLDYKLNEAKKNAPRERKAQLAAAAKTKQIKEDNPTMTKEDVKKVATRELQQARDRYGAHKAKVNFTNKEWEAVQAGAVHKTKLSSLIDNADQDQVKKLSMPRTTKAVSSSQKSTIKRMSKQGHTLAEIAEITHLSTSTVSAQLSEMGESG